MNTVDDAGGKVSFKLVLSTTANDAGVNSTLEVYLPKDVVAHADWNVGTSCSTTIGTIANCTIVTNVNYTKITMPSDSGNNRFGNGGTVALTVTIGELVVPKGELSNYHKNMYDMFLRLYSCQLNMTNKQCSDGITYGGTLDLVENFVLQSYATKYADTLISIGQTLAPNTLTRTSHAGASID